jgi:hypothetical protein
MPSLYAARSKKAKFKRAMTTPGQKEAMVLLLSCYFEKVSAVQTLDESLKGKSHEREMGDNWFQWS